MLAMGRLDFAHVLSPMPIAMSLGLGGMPAKIDALMVLSANGTVIGVSSALDRAMREGGWSNSFDNPVETAAALFSAGEVPLRVGVPFRFPCIGCCSNTGCAAILTISPDKIEIITVPPPQMAQAVRDGHLDVFCVGEPWGTVAVQQSDATLILPSKSIWQFAPEKVLAARHDWVEDNPETCHAMIRAIYKAAKWLGQSENITFGGRDPCTQPSFGPARSRD